MTIIFFWVAFSIVVGVAANSRGRNGGGWFFLALLISPIISGLLVLALPRLNSASNAFQLDGVLKETPFRKLPNGEVEAMMQGGVVRFKHINHLRTTLGMEPEAPMPAAPKPLIDEENAKSEAFATRIVMGLGVVVAIIVLAAYVF
jgi:hypothetical protein